MANTSKSIDNLVIKITANASEANKSLDTLIRNVTNLGNALNGVDTKTFTNGIKDIGSAVKGVNLSNFQKQMSKMSRSMSDYARNMVKVARNTRTGTSGFNAFNRGVTSMYSGLSRINSKINDFAFKIKKANKETKNFAQTVGLLYARFFLLIRGAKALIGAVKSSMNYIEVLNYFDASFGQVAERGVDKWSEMGYDSAEAYYNSFADRAKKVTSDMSGFFPEKNGTLTPTGMKSLGMNPQQLMQYQSQFAQMSSSMGTTSEQALKLSEVLTKIGADLASVKNMEFEDVWKDMASGLVGMSRTLDKYGVNIRNANMEMKLHELGINANVKSLSQADKALLRTIILLDSATYAWGDLAETLNTPANQFRMLTNNIKLLGQMIGNIFLPIVAKILPYLNAFVIALQRLFTWLAKVLGIDLEGLMGKNQGYDNSNLSDLLDDAEDLSGALDDDTNSAKKLKKQLQGFDALNNLTTNEDKDKGLDSALASGLLNDAFLDAVEKYLKAWQDAYDQIANKAEQIADKIARFFKRLAKPIFEAWKNVGKKVVQQWKNAGYNLKLLFKQIGKDFWRVWEQPKTVKIFEDIFSIFGNLGEVVQHLANRFREAWVAGDSGFRILQGIRDIVEIITDNAREMSESMVEWAKKINLKPLLAKMADFIESIQPAIRALMGVLKDFLNQVLLPLAKWTLEKGLPDLIQVFIDFFKKVPWEKLRARLSEFWKHLEPFAKKVGEGIIIFIERITDAIANFVKSERFEKFLNWLEKKMDGSTPEDIADALEKIAKAIIGIKLAVMGFSVLSTAVATIKTLIDVFKGIKGVGKGLLGFGKAIKDFYTMSAVGIGATTMMKLPISSLGTAFAGLASDAGLKTAVLTAGTTIGTTLIAGITASIVGFKFGKWIGKNLFKDDAKFYENFSWTGEGGFFEALGDEISIEFENMKTNVSAGAKAIKDTASTEFETMKTNVSAGIQAIKDDINSLSNISEYDRFEAGLDYIDQKLAEVANSSGNINTAFAGFAVDLSVKLMNIQDKVTEWKSNFVNSISEFGISLGIKLVEIQDKFAELKNNIKNKLIGLGVDAGVELWNLYSKFQDWKEKVKILFDPEAWAIVFEGIYKGAQEAWNKVTSWFDTNVFKKLENVKVKIGNIVESIKKIISKLNFNFSMNTKLEQHGKLPSFRATGRIYANGGFPEDGMFFANHNELVGKFENGKTAVANNEQIVSGIQNGVYGAMSESNALLMEQNALLQAILEKETGINANDIFRSVQRSASNYSKQYGKPAFS